MVWVKLTHGGESKVKVGEGGWEGRERCVVIPPEGETGKFGRKFGDGGLTKYAKGDVEEGAR